MTTVFLLFSLLIPDVIEAEANELFVRDSTEPKSEMVELMLAKYDREYAAERTLEIANSVFEN